MTWRQRLAAWRWRLRYYLTRRKGEGLEAFLMRDLADALEAKLDEEARLRCRLTYCSCVQGVSGGIVILGGPGGRTPAAWCQLHGEVPGVTVAQALEGSVPLGRRAEADEAAGGFLVPGSFADDLAKLIGDEDGEPQGILRRPATPREEE